MVGCHHQLNGHGFGWTPGVGDGQGGLVSCRPWGRKESDTTEQLTLSLCLVQSLICAQLFAIPWTATCQASLSITNSWSPPKPMSIESVMPSNHLILCHPLLLPPSIFPSIRVFSNESALRMRWPKYWSFSFSIWVVKICFVQFFCVFLPSLLNIFCFC